MSIYTRRRRGCRANIYTSCRLVYIYIPIYMYTDTRLSKNFSCCARVRELCACSSLFILLLLLRYLYVNRRWRIFAVKYSNYFAANIINFSSTRERERERLRKASRPCTHIIYEKCFAGTSAISSCSLKNILLPKKFSTKQQHARVYTQLRILWI